MSEKTHHVQDITNYYIDSNSKRSTCSSYIPRDYGIDIPVKAFIKKKTLKSTTLELLKQLKGPFGLSDPIKKLTQIFSHSTEK